MSLALLVQVAAADGGAADDPQPDPPVLETVPVVATLAEPYGIYDKLAQCESNERWHISSGNGYFGGLQEDLNFWRRHGGLAYASRPDLASREAQIAVARVGQRVQGWAAWPTCSRRLGLR